LLAIHEPEIVRMPFIHALRLALTAKGELEVVDVRPPSERTEGAGIREYLEKWGVLGIDSKRSDVASIGLRVKKVVKEGNRRRVLVNRLKRHPHDLLVVGTRSDSNHGGIVSHSLAAYLADHFRHTTLFVPSGARPFVDEATGSLSLGRIVMPVENEYFFKPAVAQLSAILKYFPGTTVEVTALHAGASFPQVDFSPVTGIVWKQVVSALPVVDAIRSIADQNRADLVVMSTNGRNTFRRKIIGSTTEQVLRNISCPLLSVSVGR
jgi:nucleotide-binding universal stress UspA family protein